MNFAIIGCGFIFQRHVDVINMIGGKIVGTCDIDKSKNATFVNYRDMLQSKEFMKDVDCIVICTPNYLHAEMVRDSLRTGKIVLCEKPLCINTDFTGLEGVNVVHQLHFHPLFNTICDKLKNANKIKAVLKAYRDDDFWNSWKGDEQKSGGVIYILGSHIIDLLVSALGNNFKIINAIDGMKKSYGLINIGGKDIEYDFEFLPSRDGQTRHLEIDGEKYVLSTKDNLSFEGLHYKVYQALINGNITKLDDVKPSIMIMDKIKKFRYEKDK